MKLGSTRTQFRWFGVAIFVLGILNIFTIAHDYGWGMFLCIAGTAFVIKSIIR